MKPPCALKVAVVGNRRFAGEADHESTDAAARMKARSTEACTAVWRAIIDAMESVLEAEVEVPGPHRRRHLRDFFDGGVPRLAVLSSLAAGADQVGAGTALAVGQTGTGASVTLDAILPFPEEDYPGLPGHLRPEFRPDEAATLATLAARARQVVRLDGRYADSEGRHRGYEQASDFLIQGADMLVAIYDPRAIGRRAGTRETVNRALKASVPVIAVLVDKDEARIAVYETIADPQESAEDGDRARSLADDRWRDEVGQHVRRLLFLPPQLPRPGETSRERKRRLESLEETLERLGVMYGEARPHPMCRWRALQLVLGLTWTAMLRLASACSRPYDVDENVSTPASIRDGITIEPYRAFYRRASRLSAAYMTAYRGAFVLSFLLAGLAVLAAVALLAAAVLAHGHLRWLALATLGPIKIGAIVVLLALARYSYRGRYQENAVDFRYMAELLRPMQWLAPLGATVSIPELPPHSAPLDPRRGWMPWLARAIFRSVPPVASPSPRDGQPFPRAMTLTAATARAALEHARSEWIDGQIVYHRNQARRMHAIEDGLDRLAKGLLWIVVFSAGLALLLEALFLKVPALATDGRHAVAVVLGAVAAVLPAFIAALGGIVFQSEAKRLRLRSEAMQAGLSEQRRRLALQIAAVPHAHGGDARRAAQSLRDLSAMTIAEAADWKVLYQTHEIHAG